MRIFSLIIVLIIIPAILIPACSPVRSNYFTAKKKQPTRNPIHITDLKIKPVEEKLIEKTPERFSDTTVIELPAVRARQRKTLADLFNAAVEGFDNEVYEEVCGKFDQFAGTITEGDSLYFESLFYKSECEIVNDNLPGAEKILYKLQADPRIPPAVLEKTSIRLGQVYCVMNLPEKANKQFSQFKEMFPNSIYSRLADCAAVQY